MVKHTFSKTEIQSLIERFEAQKIPKEEWTHPAHLVAAIWYNTTYDEVKALELLRINITAHNASVGTPNSDSDGYHETITRFWVWVAAKFLQQSNFQSIEEACNGFIKSEFSASSYPLKYYSKELLYSVEARHRWVEPDLLALQ